MSALIKRTFDIAVSAAGMLVFAPVAALIALGIKLEDGGPVLFTQERVGRHCRVFVAYKFRSMVVDAERDRKSTRLNSSHSQISYAVFCLKKKKYDQLFCRCENAA